jgi:hypothetical protein
VLEARERGFVADQGARRRKRQQVLIITVHEESALTPRRAISACSACSKSSSCAVN